jgi:hypothetical protein
MIGSLMMCVSVVVLLVGMLAGIAMGILQNFTLALAHSHLNLVGGVLLFLFGLYYRVIPAAGATLLAKVQGWLHILGAILFPAGVALVLLKGPSFEAAPITGALAIVERDMLQSSCSAPRGLTQKLLSIQTAGFRRAAARPSF